MSCNLTTMVQTVTLLAALAFVYQNVAVGGAMPQLGRF